MGLTACARKSVCRATVVEIRDGSMLVTPVEGSAELNSADKFDVPMRHVNASPEPQVGDLVEITYSGSIAELYPASFDGITEIRVIR